MIQYLFVPKILQLNASDNMEISLYLGGNLSNVFNVLLGTI